MLKSIGLALLLVSLIGCGAPKPRPNMPAVNDAANAAGAASLPAAGRYRLDPQRCELRVLVYKTGALSNLGHNHVMVNRSVTGSVAVGGTLASSSFSLSTAVADFIVDDAQARREEGDDFPGEISADAKAGTLHNMLSAAVLDATVYPVINVQGNGGLDASGAAITTLDIEVAGHRSRLVAPLLWHRESFGFSTAGSIDISQTSLGLKPYSLFMGALQVRDALRIKFKLVAVGGGL